jgi:hypothetical protein
MELFIAIILFTGVMFLVITTLRSTAEDDRRREQERTGKIYKPDGSISMIETPALSNPLVLNETKIVDELPKYFYKGIIECGKDIYGYKDHRPINISINEEYILAEEVKVLAEKDNIYKSIYDDYENDKSEYFFSCSKFNHFLNMNIKRQGIPYSIAVNLNNVNVMKILRVGQKPGYNNVVYYEMMGPRNNPNIFPYHLQGPQKSKNIWSEEFNTFTKPYFGFTRSDIIVYKRISNENYSRFETKGWPSLPEDDIIQFINGGFLYVPHGLGEEILHKILMMKEAKND